MNTHIPGWISYRLSDIYTERKEPGNESLPLLTVSIHSGVSDGELDEDELPKKVKRIEDKSQYKRAATGDLVFNMMRAWQGAIGTVHTEGMVSPAYIVAKPNDKVYPPFMDYYMKSARMVGIINRQSYGVTDFRKRLYWDSFAPIPCVLPPVREQKRIAEILSTQDKAIELQGRKIEELKRFKKGCLEKMFPRKGQKVPEKRFPGFTDDWEQRKLGDVVQITMGQSPDGSTYSDEPSDYILVQGNADLQNGWVCPRIWTTQITKKADAGDLIMSVRAPAGAMGKTAYNAVIGRGVAAIKGNEFIYQLLVKMDTDGFWKTLSCGSTFESLNSDNIKNAAVKIPTTAEQIKIGGFFQYLDNLITLHQRKLEEMKRQKKALMQLLLTGIVRVQGNRFCCDFRDDEERNARNAVKGGESYGNESP